MFTQVRHYGVEFHRRDDAQQALLTLNAPGITPSTTSTNELLKARELVTDANPATINLVVRAGDRVVITGPSGVGKTTLLHTLLGWRLAESGAATRTDSPVGFVSVESAVLSGSLRDNVTLGVHFDDAQVVEQLRSLGLEGARFSDLNVALLADGRGLSAGEKVRLVLARVLLCAPPLIVLDDIAGVLDSEAREHVRRALAALPDLAIVEATVDTPLITEETVRIEIQP
jgi:ABC-type transport system involved in cytochrome bd biosynthesis fused ATPase/permease subunit